METQTGEPDMKLVSYMMEPRMSCGLVTDRGIIDIPSNSKGAIHPHSIKEILIRGQSCLELIADLEHTATQFLDLAQLKFMSPVPRPGKLLALAGNYSEHIREAGKALGLSDSPARSTVPRPFLMPSTVVTGTQTTIPWPAFSEQVDYEIELAVMIGRHARNIAPEDVRPYIAGYMIANDISARSVTFAAGRAPRPWDEFYDWLNGKWSDGFLPLGPWLVTPDEIPDPQNLNMELKVNGEIRQKANTSQMIFTVDQIVSFISHLMTLEPGDVISTGTPAGVAMATGRFLQPGDIIECTIDKLGTLTNTLGPRPSDFYQPLLES
jgi:2-keto-4-pentenoate hydratase/2-oxohepta-3-ene-1,7-dioic acid hydratase in catechol pathway